VQFWAQSVSEQTPTFTDDIVPADCTVCDDVSIPAAARVMNSPAAAIAIVRPADSFRNSK
jgi:hypothetical protein